MTKIVHRNKQNANQQAERQHLNQIGAKARKSMPIVDSKTTSF